MYKLLPKTAKKLNRLTQPEIKAVLKLIEILGLGINYNQEFIEYLYDIRRRDNKRVNAILSQPAVKKILNSKNLPRDSKILEIRKVLRRLRFPIMTAYEELNNQLPNYNSQINSKFQSPTTKC
jgi:hypothetical protein